MGNVDDEVKQRDRVIFRGRKFTVAQVLKSTGVYGTRRLQFKERLHTQELPEIASVVKCG